MEEKPYKCFEIQIDNCKVLKQLLEFVASNDIKKIVGF
jgi:hypothetical protein